MLLPIVVVTIGLTIILSFIFAFMNVEKIKADWPNKRCNPLVMITGYLYKPSDDTRTAGEFAEANFEFCVKDMVDKTIKIVSAPIITALSLQMNSSNSVLDASNVIRKVWKNLWDTFNGIIQKFLQTFWRAGLQFRRVFEKLLSTYNRIGAILTASVYAGLSVMTGLLNLFDVIKLVVEIIIGILIGLFILMIFILAPLAPIIIVPVVAMMATLGVAVEGSDIFCFAPNSLVKMSDNTVKEIQYINVGDKLANNYGEVTGFIEMNGLNEKLWSVDGILISGSHIIWDSLKNRWAHVDNIGAIKTDIILPKLYSLTTTSSVIPLLTPKNTVILAKDWEEFSPNDILSNKLWDWITDIILNNVNISKYIPEERPLVGKSCLILKEAEYFKIDTITIGDKIWDSKINNYTVVLGVIKGSSSVLNSNIDEWISDGNWIFNNNCWTHLTNNPLGKEGIQLITESGSFSCWMNSKEYIIRDFTEVGIDKLKDTYTLVEKRINMPEFK
jgi:hypothetical protein